MILSTPKQMALFVISAIGLYYSGHKLLTTTSIQSLLEILNLIVFFACFFLFLLLSIDLTTKLFKSISKPVTN